MRRLVVFLCFFCTLNLCAQTRTFTPADSVKVVVPSDLQLSADEAMLAYTVREVDMDEEQNGWSTQIWIKALDGSISRQLTDGEQSCTSPRWTGDASKLLYMKAGVLWLADVKSNERRELGRLGLAIGIKLSPGEDKLAYLSSGEEPLPSPLYPGARVETQNPTSGFLALMVVDLDLAAGEIGRPRQVSHDTVNVLEFNWSPRGEAIAFSHSPVSGNGADRFADISIIRLADGSTEALATGKWLDKNPIFSPDGSRLAYVSQEGDPDAYSRDQRIVVLNLTNRTSYQLPQTQDTWPFLDRWSDDGRSILFYEFAGTNLAYFAIPADGESPAVSLTPTPGSHDAVLALSDARIVDLWNDASSPPELYLRDGESSAQLTSLNKGMMEFRYADTRLITWENEGITIEGLLTLPLDYQEGTRVPLIVVLHGGPSYLFTNRYTGGGPWMSVQSYAARGFALLRVNQRGSAGRGSDFLHAIYRDWGGPDTRDILSAVDYLDKMGIADTSKIGLIGHSYGGYLTARTITQSSRFTAAVACNGYYELMSFAGTTAMGGIMKRYTGTSPWAEPEILRKMSPVYDVENVITPLLIMHGGADPYCPAYQARLLYRAMADSGKEVDLAIYPTVGHMPLTPKESIDYMTRHLRWFEEYLLKK